MDYSLPAPKFFVGQLAETEIFQQTAEENDDVAATWPRYRAQGVAFQRVWLQVRNAIRGPASVQVSCSESWTLSAEQVNYNKVHARFCTYALLLEYLVGFTLL
jgi:hypothetical protein